MNRATVADRIAYGEGFTTEVMRSGVGLRREMPLANTSGVTTLPGARDDGDGFAMAEAAGISPSR